MRKAFVLIAFVFLIYCNLTFKIESQSDSLFLENVKMLQVSAAEAECKNTTSNLCMIMTPEGLILRGYGQPWVEW